jgi:hypothetical protein
MDDAQRELLAEVEAFLAERRMGAAAFGHKAVNDGKFVGRLRAGCDMRLSTLRRVREFMTSARAEAAQAA